MAGRLEVLGEGVSDRVEFLVGEPRGRLRTAERFARLWAFAAKGRDQAVSHAALAVERLLKQLGRFRPFAAVRAEQMVMRTR